MVLETAAEIGNGARIAEVIQITRTAIAQKLGFNTYEIAQVENIAKMKGEIGNFTRNIPNTVQDFSFTNHALLRAVERGISRTSIDPMTEENIIGYLLDTIALLKEQAWEAKREVENSELKDLEYNRGHLMAYCAALSLLKQQTWIFDVDQSEIGVNDICLETDLLDLHAKKKYFR